ncbi:MAG: AI-2E family transporter [Pseudomonadota bacterium]|nr:AI-2E family transporter [Pseudomonadota bacterium]
MSQQPVSHRIFIERLVIAIAIVAVALLLWALRSLLILVFGAVLVAVILSIIAQPIRRRLGVPEGVGLAIAVAIVAAVIGVAFWLFGAETVQQASALEDAIPQAWQALQARLEPLGLAEPLRQWVAGLESAGGGVLSNLGRLAMTIGNGIADTLLVIVGGIYLAAQPGLYRSGLVKLVPPGGRERVTQALEDSWKALRLWLLGRLVSMTFIGILTGLGLWLIGIPAALALAVLAFLLEFVPFIGPIIASIPAILLAIALSPMDALWVALLYFGIQQLEGNLIEPLVQQRAVDLPPALLLFSIVAGGLLFGVVGVVFAAPLLVVLFVMVKRLYVREALHTPTEIPGETKE